MIFQCDYHFYLTLRLFFIAWWHVLPLSCSSVNSSLKEHWPKEHFLIIAFAEDLPKFMTQRRNRLKIHFNNQNCDHCCLKGLSRGVRDYRSGIYVRMDWDRIIRSYIYLLFTIIHDQRCLMDIIVFKGRPFLIWYYMCLVDYIKCWGLYYFLLDYFVHIVFNYRNKRRLYICIRNFNDSGHKAFDYLWYLK